MMIRNFSQFLLEKETKGLTQWDPDGKDPWFYRYVSEITGEEIKITEDKLKELGKKGNDIEQGSKWEELYQFAKYCLTGKKTKYTDKKLEKLFVENIRDIKIDFTVKEKVKVKVKSKKDLESKDLSDLKKIAKSVGSTNSEKLEKEDLIDQIIALSANQKEEYGEIKKSSTIGNLLDKNIDSNEIKPATKGIYSNILEYIKDIDGYKDSTNNESVIKYLGGKCRPGKLDKPIFGKASNAEEAKKAEENELAASKWDPAWNIIIDPNILWPLMVQSELCVRSCLGCIQEIRMNLANKDEESLVKELSPISALIDSIYNKNNDLLGKGVKKDGTLFKFWEDNGLDPKKKKTQEEKIKLIKAKTDNGFTSKDKEDYFKLYAEVKELLKKARTSVDDGEMTEEEWERNVEKYAKDGSGSVKVGEGLRAVMYSEVKEAFSLLQSAMDNYALGDGEKNALDQYLKTSQQFIDDAKSEYTDALKPKK